MPFLIRIVLQRILVLFYSFLVFLGIAPEVSIPTEAEATVVIEERRERISDFLREDETKDKIQEIIKDTDRVRQEIEKIDLKIEIKPPTTVQIPITEPKKTEEPKEPEQLESTLVQDVIDKTVEEITTVEQSLSLKGKIDDVVVNIVCSKRDGNIINISTGSGVIIDPKGIIITNAHVAQFVLIEDNYPNKELMKCAVYRENVPTFGYLVDVLYISPEWVEQNYRLINSDNPKGTGESDYAFLYITASTNSSVKKPSSFPYADVLLNENIYEEGRRVTVAGYPGAPKTIIDIISAGIMKKDTVEITDVFTFDRHSIDVISTGNTAVGAKGASGGGVFDSSNNLIATISTTSGEQNNAKINAITSVYIDNDLRRVTGSGITSLLSKNPESQIADFSQNHGELLSKLLINQLD